MFALCEMLFRSIDSSGIDMAIRSGAAGEVWSSGDCAIQAVIAVLAVYDVSDAPIAR